MASHMIPTLRYQDAEKAIEFLVAAFGDYEPRATRS